MGRAVARSGGAFPDLALADSSGRLHRLREAWRDGAALFLIGHCDCSTTREAVPVLERIHRRRTRGRVVLVLQDEAPAARALSAELDLRVPIRLELEPFPLAGALELAAVPTLLLVARDGRIGGVSEGFRRADLEAFAERLGVAGPLFLPQDRIPAFRPG